MTLKEAIESGRLFRHRSGGIYQTYALGYDTRIPIEQAISEALEIQEKQTLSREDIEHAINVALITYKKTCSHASAMLEAMKAAESGE